MTIDPENIELALDPRALYRAPSDLARRKDIGRIDAGAADFIARSPLMVLATGSDAGLDASPRGGPPGFVRVLDERTLAFGDLVGNNRIDSYGNLAVNPAIGMLFVVPTLLETLRVNGTAGITSDAEVREACAVDGRVPNVAVVISVGECYVHCGAALRRARLWDATSWPMPDQAPVPAEILRDHIGGDLDVQVIADDLAAYYEHGVWLPGGESSAVPDGDRTG
jgi:uncharacterized protein